MAGRSLIISLLAGAVTISATTSAQDLVSSSPGFHYFHKSGAVMAEHNDDIIACSVAIRGMINGSDAMTSVTTATGGGLLGAIVGGVIDSNENRQGQAANMENCMALKGWSVIGLTEEEGKALEKWDDDPALLREQLTPYVEAPSPLGTVLRGPYANELSVGSFQVGPAGDLEEVSLSRRAVEDLTDAAIEAAGELKPPKPPKGVKAPKRIKTVKEKDIAEIDTEKAHIILSVTASRRFDLNAHNITLHRLAEDGSEVVYDGLPITTSLGGNLNSKIRKTRDGEERRYDFLAEVPPGVWKMATIYWANYGADLCFGAPAFAINEGETLFLGTMQLSEEGGYPLDQTDLSVAKEILSPLPILAERVKFAALMNGFTSDCFGSYAYAYEQPGSPSVDDPAGDDVIAEEIIMPDETPIADNQ